MTVTTFKLLVVTDNFYIKIANFSKIYKNDKKNCSFWQFPAYYMWARNCQESLFGFFCCVLAKFWKRRQFLTISSSLYINWNCQELLTFWKCSHFLVIPCLHIVSWELPGTCCIFGNSQEPLSFLTPVSGYSQPIDIFTPKFFFPSD